MRPLHSAHESHRSNATEDMSLTLEQTFARTSRRNVEKGSSFYSHNGEQRRPSSSATHSSSRMSANVYMMNHSLSYTSHNGLDIVGEEFDDVHPPSNSQLFGSLPPSSRYFANEGGSSPTPPSGRRRPPTGRNEAILEDRPFHNTKKQPARPPPEPKRANVPPLPKIEPQHVDVSAPSRRCLQKPFAPVMVTGDEVQQPGNISIRCQSCRIQLWAAKTALVVRCPQCRAVTSEAACVYVR